MSMYTYRYPWIKQRDWASDKDPTGKGICLPRSMFKLLKL